MIKDSELFFGIKKAFHQLKLLGFIMYAWIYA